MHKDCIRLRIDAISHGVRQTITGYKRRSFVLSALNAAHHHFYIFLSVYSPHGFLCILFIEIVCSKKYSVKIEPRKYHKGVFFMQHNWFYLV